MPHPVTLSSDFGRFYPAAMRGVLARRGIDRIHDVDHTLPAHDIRQSAFWLRSVLPYFPRAVHCVVVDPGVGGERAVAVLRAGGHAIVCPDNGVGWPAARALAAGGSVEAFRFDHAEPESHTFHGRDVFAPVAAAVATVGIDRLEALPTVALLADPVALVIPVPDVESGGLVTEIVAVDRFGNAITSAPGERLPSTDEVEVDGTVVPVARRYGSVAVGAPLVTIGSHGHVELAANQAAGTDAFGVDVGDRVRISWS